MIDTSIGASIVLEKTKGKITVAASNCQAFKNVSVVVSLSFTF